MCLRHRACTNPGHPGSGERPRHRGSAQGHLEAGASLPRSNPCASLHWSNLRPPGVASLAPGAVSPSRDSRSPGAVSGTLARWERLWP